ncbi:hypothetical protein SCHPADRAFT_897976 [Schizopora paradoxa]|uniref:Uncharacterized protein n=1 Tax=Schizopora paradoxa TaxID=27342 RepID=A0A0H2SA30_9AGAM|nr:hypothetical protein SCHPADRAFT_897976 [Schizopora paradoxa]
MSTRTTFARRLFPQLTRTAICEPRWMMDLWSSSQFESLYEQALEKAPECVREEEESMTVICLIAKYERILRSILNSEIGVDVCDVTTPNQFSFSCFTKKTSNPRNSSWRTKTSCEKNWR